MREVHALLLAAGLGTRLSPLTDKWPKCLMPVGGRPLLEYWLCTLKKSKITKALVNMHHHHHLVESFLNREKFRDWVVGVYEPQLLGTAGTLRKNAEYFGDQTVLLVHADNWCQCKFRDFLEFHENHRPGGTLITMMTFRTNMPTACGIVELDHDGVVQNIHEKVVDPPGNLANGAVYLLESEVASWVKKQPSVTDFSTEVLPHFLGRIATWENTGVHRDIGTSQSLLDAQGDPKPSPCWPETDEWMRLFQDDPIHRKITAGMR